MFSMRIYKSITKQIFVFTNISFLNIGKIQYMTIRELAKELEVSTSTILRFCNKNNFDGYSEFKEALKKEITLQAACQPMEDLQEFSDFLQGQIQVRLRKIFQYGAFCHRA